MNKAILIILLFFSVPYTPAGAESVNVTINGDKVLLENRFQQGVQLDYYDWQKIVSSNDKQIYIDYLKDMNCKLIRLFVSRQSGLNPSNTDPNKDMGPCTSWNSKNHTGVFYWNNLDQTIDTILSIGAEPVLVLMIQDSPHHFPKIPRGMMVTDTNLPDASDYAAYCAEYAQRYQGKVKYYEVMNEPYFYWGFPENTTQVDLLLNIYEASYVKMKQMDPSLLISFDAIVYVHVFNYMKSNNIPFDFYDFHGYGGSNVTDSTTSCLDASEYYYSIKKSSESYTIAELKQMMNNTEMPVINSESNFNSAWIGGTDPRNCQIEGVCFDALQTIYAIKGGTDYRVHYYMVNSKTQSAAQPTGGWGFGIINSDDDSAFLPYYFCHLIGKNLSLGDNVIESNTTNPKVESIAWIHRNLRKILVVNRGETALDVSLPFAGNYTEVDGTTYGIHTGNNVNTIRMEPYSIILYSETHTFYPYNIVMLTITSMALFFYVSYIVSKKIIKYARL